MAKVLNAEELISRIPIVDENIFGEALTQPQLFVEGARYRIARMRLRSEAEAKLDYLTSSISVALRKRGEAGEKKMTEAAIKEKVASHHQVREQRAIVEKMYAAEEFAKLLLDALKQRRDAIRVTAEAQIYEGMKDTREIERIEHSTKLRKAARRLAEQRREQHLD